MCLWFKRHDKGRISALGQEQMAGIGAVESRRRFLRLEKGIEKGIDKGVEKHQHNTVVRLLKSGRFSDAGIAEFAGVTLRYVQQARKKNEAE